MNLDDHVCLCFHVSKRKIVNFIRIERPQRVSQISECLSAGTGCGWCRPVLKKLFEQANRQTETLESSNGFDELSAEEYAQRRSVYVQKGRGQPPPNAPSMEP